MVLVQNEQLPGLNTLEIQSPEKFRRISTFSVIKASVKKELQIMIRYKANFIGMIIRAIIFILLFWFFASSLTFTNFDAHNDERSIFIFYLSGMILMFYDGTALYKPINTVTRDLYNGTLESVYTLPSSRYSYFLGSSIASAVVDTTFVTPIIIVLVIYTKLQVTNLLLILFVILLTLSTLIAMGILIALLAILFRQVSSLVGVLGMLFQFVGGAIFPVTSLPIFLQYFAYLFPYTWGFDLMRYYSFGGSTGTWETLLPVPIMWMILVAFTVIFGLLSKVMLRKVENQAKSNGLHLL
ncbi:MAG: ABC transporter permease [Candidatus Kariarchaeaceae archaeon]|jgi:ABC-2 type transport system permease protein